jgi:7-carboxy-7-deazaguanine synthase
MVKLRAGLGLSKTSSRSRNESLTLNSQKTDGFIVPAQFDSELGSDQIMRSPSPKPNGGDDLIQSPGPQASGSLKISETFTSLQGEGLLTGTKSFFIRTSGCNLRCWFCDTPYASWEPEGEFQAVSGLVDAAIRSGASHVVLTGGEPLLPFQSIDLVRRIRDQGLHVTIETAGTIYRPLQADLMSISPKLAGSGPTIESKDNANRWQKRHEHSRWRPEVIHRLIESSVEYQIKFVVHDQADFDDCLQAVESLAIPADHVWIMPQGTSDEVLDRQITWLLPIVQSLGFRYCDRMHVRWYGNRRGT